MNECPRCGQPTSMWSRDLATGLCKACVASDAEKKAKLETQRKEEEQKRRETLVVAGKTIDCPICGHDRFNKQQTLMNTRGATFMNLDWLNAGAETCICKQCGYVLWFRNDS